MEALIDAKYAELLSEERETLGELKSWLEKTDTNPQVVEQVADMVAHLDALFLIVFVGEFNAGKSSVINALFGTRLMEEGPIPTTAKVTIIRQGEEALERQLSEYLVEKRIPSPHLVNLNLVDTPGTNSIVKQHQVLTERFIPRADLVLFVTSFDRPLSESERQFLEYIRDSWGKRLIFVLNKIDMSRDEEMLKQVVEHVRSGCSDLMDFEPRIFPVSAHQAYQAKQMQAGPEFEALWSASRFEAFETFVTEQLTDRDKVSIKLSAPLDAADRLIATQQDRIAHRERVLEQDEKNLDELDERVEGAKKTLTEGYGRHVTEVDNLLLQLERRGVQFLDDTIRISKLSMIRDRDQFKEEFVRQVVRDTDKQVEDQVTQAVDGLLKQALQLWNQTVNDFADRVRSVAGSPTTHRGDFFYNRSEVFNTIMREAGRKTEMYDLREEARRILENTRNAAAFFMGAEAVAAGIGAIATIVATASALDVTGGFIAAGVFAIVGLIFLPRQKRKAIDEFKERVEALRNDMKKALTEQLDEEVAQSISRISDTVAPYVDFVRRERNLIDEITIDRQNIEERVATLRRRIKKAFGDIGVE